MRSAVSVAAACLCIVGLSFGQDARALIRQRIDIPAQELGSALKQFAQARGLEVLYFSDTVKGLSSPGASGDLTADEALTKLLAGTGLRYRYVDEKAINILPPAASSAVSSGSAPKGDSTTQGDQKSAFWGRFRLAEANKGVATSSSSVDVDSGRGSDQNAAKLEEIIVTAQKREERLIDTPQSVSVLSAATLANLDAVQFRDFANTVPGLSFFTHGAGETQISLRGVTAGSDVSPTVGIYVDEVPYGASSALVGAAYTALDVGLFDVDRIEVLRGPQGTLYGASSLGGVIKYVTKRPDLQSFNGDVQTSVAGTQDGGVSYNVSAVANAPIVTDKLAVRASGFESHDGGYIDNVTLGQEDVNRSDIYGGRVDFLAQPTEPLSIRLTGFLQNISRDGHDAADYTFAGVPVTDSLTQHRRLAEPFEQRFRLVSGTIHYDAGPVALSSISSYQTVWSEIFVDISPLYLPILARQHRSYSAVGLPSIYSTNKFTQEVRLSAEGARRLEWIIGGFYTQETSDPTQQLDLFDPAGQPAPNDVLALSTPVRHREYAAFGDLTWHLTSRLDVTGGLRFARNQLEVAQNGSGLFGASKPEREAAENVVTYLANTRYHLNDHATLYLRYATGYRPGGPNYVGVDPVTGAPLAPPSYKADTLKSYEAGYKAESADRRFAVDLAAYYIDWNDIQVSATVKNFGVRVNAPGGATVKGSELTLSARPVPDFTITSAFAYQDARMSEANTFLGAYQGERLPNVPRFTGSLNADYALGSSGWRPTIGATVRYVSDRWGSFDKSTTPQYRLPAYTLVDLRAGATFGSVNTQLYVHNLANQRSQLSVFTSYGTPYVDIAQPRTIGITLSTHF